MTIKTSSLCVHALYFAAVAGVLLVAPLLPKPGELALDALASAAAAGWCAWNFWSCRQAHCLMTAAGWFVLAAFIGAEAVIGRSLIAGYEQPVFLAVLGIGVLFEGGWFVARGTNAVNG